jgi:uncharacterized protein YndB with AHSA1/START domain
VIDGAADIGPSVGPVDEESIDIDAPPERVWALITDVTQMGRWSPECYSCTWLDGAGGPTVGARFKGRNKRGLLRWATTSKVVTAEEPSHFAFEVKDSQMRWGYRLAPSGSGTTVREYREVIGPKPLHVRVAYALRLLGRDPDAIVRAGMQETLARLKAGAEASQPA